MNSIFAKIFLAIQSRINDKVTGLSLVDQDFGQLDSEDLLPGLTWPCLLIDMEDTSFSPLSDKAQIGECTILLRLAFGQVVEEDPEEEYSDMATAQYNLEHNIHLALQGYGTTDFGPLMRSSAATEKRDDGVRVRWLRYTAAFEDRSTSPVYTSIQELPDADISVDF